VETVGLDLGGTKILAALVTDDGDVVAEHRVPTPDTDAAAIVEALAGAAVAVAGGRSLVAVGVGAAGLVDAQGTVRYAPNVPALIEFPLAQRLSDRLGMPVAVDNDANAAAWGEAIHGAARGVDDVLVVTLGTGIGGGIITGGRLYRGANGFAAEIGHFPVVDEGPACACGIDGHWEAMASGTALGVFARRRAAQGDIPDVVDRAGGDPEAVTGEHVTASALEGDPAAIALVEDFAGVVALGLAGLANILDPALVVIGGGLVTLGDTLLDPLRTEFRRLVEAGAHRPEIPVVAAELGERAGAIGAAALARGLVGG